MTQMLEKSALRVPETAKTCIDASAPATEVTAAKEALTEGKVISVVRITKTLRSASWLIKANPVLLAPTSPYNFVTLAQTVSSRSLSLGDPSHSSCIARYRRLMRFMGLYPPLGYLCLAPQNIRLAFPGYAGR